MGHCQAGPPVTQLLQSKSEGFWFSNLALKIITSKDLGSLITSSDNMVHILVYAAWSHDSHMTTKAIKPTSKIFICHNCVILLC